MDQVVAELAAEAPSPAVDGGPVAPAVLTWRAVVIGLLLAGVLALVTPWNDWYVKNTYFYSNYMPPVVTAVLLFVGVVLNPLLGRRRLRAAELAVITVMALGVGGVISSGLMRLWPGAVAGASRHVARNPSPVLKTRIAAGDDGPDWRWAVPGDLYLGFPARGDVPVNDAEYHHVVDGYLDGLPRTAEPRVGHRARITWTDAAGVRHQRELALSGEALAAARGGSDAILDLDSPEGRALRGLKAGQRVAVPGGEAAVEAVAPPGVPWYAWIGPLLAWAPLLGGTIVASVAIAFLVRRQWIEHERLAYPVAATTLTLLADPEPGRRLAAIYRERGFWLGLAVAAVAIVWRGLYALQVVSVDLMLDVDLIGPANSPFSSDTFRQFLDPWFLFHPHLYFSIFALSFFLPLDLSFSLWFFYVLGNVVVWALRQQGLEAVATYGNARAVGYGAFLAMAPLTVWLGRSYYLRVMQAAVRRGGDEGARAAAPYVWAALAGAAAITVFFAAHGVSWPASALMTVLFLGSLLVISRVLAEAGVPFLQVPLNIDTLCFSLVGFGMPAGALVALSTVGMTLLPDGRESLMPYAANAAYLGERTGLPHRRLAGLMIAAACIGVVLGAGSMLWNSYTGTGHQDGWTPYAYELDALTSQKAAADNPATADQFARTRSEQLVSYGIGAAATIVCGVGRMLFSAWPLHPLAWCVAFTYPASCSWFSFFLAWVCKGLAMRYGGVGLYKRLKPVAIGLIAGEALAMSVFMVVKIIATLTGHTLQPYNALPG